MRPNSASGDPRRHPGLTTSGKDKDATREIFTGWRQGPPVELETEGAQAVLISTPAWDKTTGNQDAAGFWELGLASHVLAVADGMGGGPGGAEAASIAIHALDESIRSVASTEPLRSRILDAFEEANRRVLAQGIGSGTTLIVVEVSEGIARSYHAGDSGALLVGQRGKVKFGTIPHSPVGYGVASGMLDQDDVHHHDERHLLSNCIGSHEMRVEMGASVRMAQRDTLLLASDGVLDNVQRNDLIDLIRAGALRRKAAQLQERIAATMEGNNPALPEHPDDATALLFRLRGPRRGARKSP